MPNLLEVSDVRVRYRVLSPLMSMLTGDANPFVDAVSGVSFSLAEGQTYALVGESGSGKTTLARAINGLVKTEIGSSIRFNDTELTGLSQREFRTRRSDMAMMFQDPIGSLSPRQTVRSLLKEPFQAHGMTDRDLDAECFRLLGLVGLPRHFADRYPHQLSGGQARRVGLARAVALDPKLVIADEPTAGLDVSIQGDVINLLNSLQDRLGLAILIITHNLHVVRHIAHRAAIMYLGRLVEEGATEKIFRAPAHPYTKALLAASHAPDANADRIALKGEVPSLKNRPNGCEFHTRCPYVQEKCRLEFPLIDECGNDHACRCHFPLGEAPASLRRDVCSILAMPRS